MVLLGVLGGVLLGTAIAVLLDRLYTGAPFVGRVLTCAGCRAPAPRRAWLGVPGYLLLGGGCPTCGGPLPSRLLYLPVLGGVVIGLAVARTSGVHLALALLFLPVLLALTATDFERRLLPNRVLYPALALGVALAWAWPGRSTADVLTGGLLGFAIMYSVWWIMPGFGFGDVKLAGLLGLLAGVSGLLNALLLAALSAGVVAAVLLLTRRAGRRSVIAYGPYLAFAAAVSLLAG
jgi:prepilin signal peptidase PulO-like enzyme (type II secretory pathway)